MHRRVLAVLLLPCVLLMQFATVGSLHGHVHSVGQPTGHNLPPHIHAKSTQATITRHDHQHHDHHTHGHGVHHHHDFDDGDDACSPMIEPTPLGESLPGHDSDAVYLAAFDVVPGVRHALSNDVELEFIWSTPCLNTAMLISVNSALVVMQSHPPPRCTCPLYIRHLTLLM